MRRTSHLTLIKGFDAGLVESLIDDALALPSSLPVLGISGLPGSGKSTLARQLALAGKRRDIVVVAMSLDDFYLSWRQRLALAKSVHPLLATRGPPGTHDLALAHVSLDALVRMRPSDVVALPRFDKLLDRRLPPSRWQRIRTPPRLIVLEGWCLGVPPEDKTALAEPINALERNEDGDGRWRQYCNEALRHYQSLWQRIDRLLVLHAPDFRVIPQWRWQQELAMQAARPRANGMSRAQTERFVQLFERVGRQALRALPALAGRVLALDEQRRLKPVE